MRDDEKPLPVPVGWEEDLRLAFPSEYLGQQHLRGHDVTMTIAKVELPELKMARPGAAPQRKLKLVVTFAELQGRTDGTPCRWICGVTSYEVIRDLYGKAKRDWIGKRITLYADPSVMMGKKKVGGLRVRPVVPPAKRKNEPAPQVGPMDDDHKPPDVSGAMSDEEAREIQEREREEGR